MSPHLYTEAFEPFPLLETRRLRLRAPQPGDAGDLFRLYADINVMRYRGAPVFSEPAEADALLAEWAQEYAGRTAIRWVLCLRGDDACRGSLGFKTINSMQFRAEAGYELDPALWNQGLMTEALEAVVGWGFRSLGLHSAEANIAPGNAASRRVLEKLGFVQEAHFHENWWFEGWWDSVIYSKINPDT